MSGEFRPLNWSPDSLHAQASTDDKRREENVLQTTFNSSPDILQTRAYNDDQHQDDTVPKRPFDKHCGVCGDSAIGYNFNAISCGPCKAFFRRNALKGLSYFICPYEGKCTIDSSTRRFCKRCRLCKCFEIGMKKEFILTEEEKSKRKQRKEGKGKSTEGSSPLSKQSDALSLLQNNLRCLQPEEACLIKDAVKAYRESLAVSMTPLIRNRESELGELVNMAELSVRKVIDMVKKIQSFKALSQSDQINLLKGGASEFLILKSVIKFDKGRQQWLDPLDNSEFAVTIEQMKTAVGQSMFEDHMKFTKDLVEDEKVDETVLILLLMISLFSPDRPNVTNSAYISQEQDKYSLLLLRYLQSRFPPDIVSRFYPKMLMKLTDIRSISEGYSRKLSSLNQDAIQPLMKEILHETLNRNENNNGS